MIVGSPTKLNLIPSGVMPVVYISQGDAGYDKEFLIYNGDSPYNVPSGVSATIRGTKADGYGVTEAATVTTGSNLVTVTITEQMVAAAGTNVYELVFVDTNDLRVASINMVWAVKKDALGDSVISDSDLDYATTVMNQLQSVQAFKNQLDTNTDGLAAETAARIAADNTLQTNIDSEANTRHAADTTLQTNINSEASTRLAQDASLQSQINQLVAPTGSAPSAAEVQNARIGANGTTYSTLGDAIRTQITAEDTKISAVNALAETVYTSLGESIVSGSIASTSVENGYFIRFINGAWQKTANQFWYIYEFSVSAESLYRIYGSKGTTTPVAIFADANNNYIMSTEIPASISGNYERETLEVTTPKGCTKIYVNQFGNNVPATCESLTVIERTAENSNTLNVSDVLTWELGGITNGNNTASTTRIRTARIYRFAYPIVIPVNQNVSIGVWTYSGYDFSNNPSWAGWVSDAKSSYIIPAGTYFRLLTMDGGTAKQSYIKLYNYDFVTLNAYDYVVPIKWRRAIINATGALYFSKYGLASDLLIPSAIVDYVIKKVSASSAYVYYYSITNGKPVYNSRATIGNANAPYYIDKSFPYIALHVFVSWSTELNVSDADTYISAHYLPTAEKMINTVYLYDVLRSANTRNGDLIFSICHQGYSDDGLGNNLAGGYAKAASRGFTHGECDIKLTSDNKVVCSHDPSFVDSVTGTTIVIAEHTLAELQTYSYYGGTISTLSDIIAECKASGIGLFIDQVSSANAAYAIEVVKQHNAFSMCYFMSGDVQVLETIITADNSANIVYLTSFTTSISDVLPSLIALNHDIIYDVGQYTASELNTIKNIAAALPGNIALMIWTVDYTDQLTDALPYICGWTSNAISGRDIFNPAQNMGLEI